MFDSPLKLSENLGVNWSYMCKSQVKSAVMVVIIKTWLRLGDQSHLLGLGNKSRLVLKLVCLLC